MLLYLRPAAAARGWGAGGCTPGAGWPWPRSLGASPSHSHPQGSGYPQNVGLWQKCSPQQCPVTPSAFHSEAPHVSPARGDGRAPVLRTLMRSSPRCFPRWGPLCSPQSCTRCRLTVLLPSPFPEERDSLAWWRDAAGCVSCHAFSLLRMSAQAPPLPLLAASSGTSTPVSAVQPGKLRHGAATWFAHTANPRQSRDPDTRALTLGCAIHPCGAGADARGACPAPCPSAGGGLGAPCPWPGSSAALAHGWAVLRCQAAVTPRDGWLQSAFLHYK